ncbi:Tll0287-like domain-containing protein [Gelidibacter maritimus]|uniref:DUF3365 domain-containing protein n=1 Tax=Gelidibacter maritimus TaxID=2761487 RepID=A0A7W2R237_9FLAO|nr:DUF3365 domain-containing protein [Gelidibacter maritimus]MBA6151377.1 DUF3365 domain-containing protein [Gelidibacter maritimus]
MKNLAFAIIAFISFYSCNDGKKTKSISVEEKVDHQSHQEKTASSKIIDTTIYAERGVQYALSAQAVLGKNLMQAIKKDGTIGALSFCNEKAYPLTDSMAVVHNVQLKRVSDKPRNQNNQANTEELEVIETYKKSIASQDAPEPMVKTSDAGVQIYFPILTNPMCMQCHGKPKNIESPTLKKLTVLYPEDKALGYDLNEVRGIWKVTFDN